MRIEIEGSIDNVYIFVADALRYGSTPDTLSEFGTVIEAIASSTVTCTSYPSMVTGRYPTEHGV
jgi:predicted AlkP superfamily pyrophosphatase or phosphodiesterase